MPNTELLLDKAAGNQNKIPHAGERLFSILHTGTKEKAAIIKLSAQL